MNQGTGYTAEQVAWLQIVARLETVSREIQKRVQRILSDAGEAGFRGKITIELDCLDSIVETYHVSQKQVFKPGKPE